MTKHSLPISGPHWSHFEDLVQPVTFLILLVTLLSPRGHVPGLLKHICYCFMDNGNAKIVNVYKDVAVKEGPTFSYVQMVYGS